MASSSSSTTTKPTIRVSISDAYDGGNIKFVGTEEVVNEDGEDILQIRLEVRPDPYTELEKTNHMQYFSFRSTVQKEPLPSNNNNNNKDKKEAPASVRVRYVIENAGKVSYPQAWDGTTTFASVRPSDPDSWTRVLSTTYDSETKYLSWTYLHGSKENTDEAAAIGQSVYFAYFPPFSYERHLQLISRCASMMMEEKKKTTSIIPVSIKSLGQTLDGREMDCITVGNGPMIAWIIHRQHPGETMAEFYAEGLLTRLLGLESSSSVDGTVRQILEKYTLYIVPNMCPDGSARGHLRTNACGSNLNREWCATPQHDYDAPTLERSPEVYHVLKAMDETGVDCFIDVHGDEELPFNFLSGSQGMPNWGKRLEALHGIFLAAYERANSFMQKEISYEPDPPNEGKPNICSNQIAVRFDCLSVTLEMPFKDCLTHSDPTRGWDPAKSRMLGSSLLDALLYVHPYLRSDKEFWNALSKQDAYVHPTEKYIVDA